MGRDRDNTLSMFVHSISLNISHQEGIERFLIFLKENEDLETQIAYIERLYRFFDEDKGEEIQIRGAKEDHP